MFDSDIINQSNPILYILLNLIEKNILILGKIIRSMGPRSRLKDVFDK
jgi:hypothetical protein